MAYSNTGYQRSMTLVVRRLVGGTVESSTTYDGRLAFGTYGAITATELAQMSQSDFQQRLDDFIDYVESLVPGLDVSAVTEAGTEARRYNTSACPL